MEKKIEDYLHFYIGCKAIQYRKYPDESIVPSEMTISHYLIHCLKEQNQVLRGDVKPLLRPLSDMTEEDKLILYGMGFTHNSKGMQILHPKEWSSFNPKQFHYLLSKGFDIFGLIESGLAIDSTKANKTNN